LLGEGSVPQTPPRYRRTRRGRRGRVSHPVGQQARLTIRHGDPCLVEHAVFQIPSPDGADKLAFRVNKHLAAYMPWRGTNALYHRTQRSRFVVFFDFSEGLKNVNCHVLFQ